MKDISKLQKRIETKFKNEKLLQQALVHRSYLNENPSFELDQNERLEFLGDAVLELVVTDFLYLNYENPEGELTNWRASLVNATNLATVARELNIEEFLYLSKGESKDDNVKARNYILANAMEAIIGAIYLDKGYDEAEKFISSFIISKLPDILEHKLYLDAKTAFQEASQEKMGITPTYHVISEEGPDHNKIFTIEARLENEAIAQGKGTSKQEAETDAAREALKEKGW
ncbi:MAG: ribonuclease III [Parcubacteria group bacterium CG_4_9_14_0_2_um_filter_41_8]|nr:MAG: ribonuclease III [Parcubacteria group bacterium CG1_02_41_12]PIP66821.1 MAG: ribonuclease III [Parcubacteria group bacterium CG22_combo_CG10-13_8_21_14_all_41_9]PIQ80492.1 MAG: ribonuclease III [Parcubacteria group bacterium CG11_big_fil_rev_8_21_14_0_20_41_14]PIZ80751.1 MAG: ribonuclease III [Parcubacteria group bacterium CG_4_10_14_0_2_um_filter_41_6]PJC41010.1 MAG: ribonuclease III [Parcubacteria group bacterium CG_4_9_14_0_2_um_filter_41_8]